MDGFKFPLGSLVMVNPTGLGNGPVGRVSGHILFEGGDKGYWVTIQDFSTSGVIRHMLDGSDLIAFAKETP